MLPCRGDHVHARYKAGELIAGGDVLRSPVSSVVPIPKSVLERHQPVALDHLPFHLARMNGNIGDLARFVRRELRRGAIARLTEMLIEADDLSGRADLVRQLDRGEPLNLLADGRRSIRVEPAQAIVVVPTFTSLNVEPELIPDDAATQFGGSIPPRGDGVAAGDALCPQLVIEVVALQFPARLNQLAASVKVVAPRFDDDGDLNATARSFCRIGNAGDQSLLEYVGIEPVSALVAALWRGGDHSIHLLP